MNGRSAAASLLVAIAALGTAVAPSRALGLPGVPWASVGLLGGPRVPDAHLADYRWTARPALAWGAEARVGAGRFALGTRFQRESDTQQLDLPDGVRGIPVRLTSVEALAQVRLLSLAGTCLAAEAAVGRLHLGWRPDRIELATGGTPVVVELHPVSAPVFEAGGSVERALSPHWSLGIGTSWRRYALDTAHRNGSLTEYRRESFHDWSARAQFARRLTWR